MASLTERLSKDTDGIKDFFATHENVYIYAHVDRVLVEHLIYLIEKMGLKPAGFILEHTSSENSKVCGYPAKGIASAELNETDGVIIAAPEEIASILNLKVKDKSFAIDTYIPEGFGKHTDIPSASDFVDPKAGFFGRFTTLDDVGGKYNAEQSSEYRDYFRKYELFFQYFRDNPITILSLGVFHGESIYTYNSPEDGYFQNAKVIGIDANPDSKAQMPNQDNFLLSDLYIEELLDKIKVVRPTIIIDSASHLWSHQIKSLFCLWDSLKSGGLYIVEHVDTSFKNSGFVGFDDSVVSAFEICRDIAEIATGGSFIGGEHPFEEETRRIANDVDMISFIKGSCIMVKK